MPLDAGTRKSLSAKGNRVEAKATIAAGAPADSVVVHIARTFSEDGLTKVRINAVDREECEQTARALAERLAAELVQVVGRVALLYRAPAPEDEGEELPRNAG